jgi:hypothetical protein
VNLPDVIKNVRGTNWTIVDGFEIFAGKITTGAIALRKALEEYSFRHLEREINYYTDAYRLYWAHEHAKSPLRSIKLSAHNFKSESYPGRAPNFLRLFGLHNLRKWIYLPKPRQSL